MKVIISKKKHLLISPIKLINYFSKKMDNTMNYCVKTFTRGNTSDADIKEIYKKIKDLESRVIILEMNDKKHTATDKLYNLDSIKAIIDTNNECINNYNSLKDSIDDLADKISSIKIKKYSAEKVDPEDTSRIKYTDSIFIAAAMLKYADRTDLFDEYFKKLNMSERAFNKRYQKFIENADIVKEDETTWTVKIHSAKRAVFVTMGGAYIHVDNIKYSV